MDPLVLRTYLLSVHYRTPLDFSLQGLEEWGRGLQRIWRLWEEAKDAPAPSEWIDAPWAKRLRTFESNFLSFLDDDFNTARAFAEIFDMVHNHIALGIERVHSHDGEKLSPCRRHANRIDDRDIAKPWWSIQCAIPAGHIPMGSPNRVRLLGHFSIARNLPDHVFLHEPRPEPLDKVLLSACQKAVHSFHRYSQKNRHHGQQRKPFAGQSVPE